MTERPPASQQNKKRYRQHDTFIHEHKTVQGSTTRSYTRAQNRYRQHDTQPLQAPQHNHYSVKHPLRCTAGSISRPLPPFPHLPPLPAVSPLPLLLWRIRHKHQGADKTEHTVEAAKTHAMKRKAHGSSM
jgi:hypothetical protein